MTTKRTTKKATRKPPSEKTDSKEQYERFRQFAGEHGADDTPPEVFDRMFGRVVPPKRG